MDGYAVIGKDVAKAPARLKVIGEAPAGQAFKGRVKPGQTVRIFTGAPLPAGSDTVVIQENCQADGDQVDVLEVAVVEGRSDCVQNVAHLAGVHLALGNTLFQLTANVINARFGSAGLIVMKNDRVASLGGNLSNTGAHGTCANHTNNGRRWKG